ncbi:MAG TPA: saccharopine dehydrogenase C-terminal domain-containing protein [Bacteroidia bacterium]|nr:saccharopine dehydrogenase C-terminal domain-containing protein [Bacteroidia bacterium]
MKRILVIGAGRSSSVLISYLLKQAELYNWQVIVADSNIELAKSKINQHQKGIAEELDVFDVPKRQKLIKESDFVISMLPASMHIEVAEDCLRFSKSMANASYVSDSMRQLDKKAKEKNIVFFNELGLDPGIDHASAMKIIDSIHQQGGKIITFRSYCGGLVAPESNDNPWGYKISWNPRNVVMAGNGTAEYLSDGKIKLLPYQRLFEQHETIKIENYIFDAYANRNSIQYIDAYKIPEVKNILRGTLRYKGFCKAWNIIVNLGLTDDNIAIDNLDNLSYKEWLEMFLPTGNETVQEKLIKVFGDRIDNDVMKKLEYLKLFSEEKIQRPTKGTSAMILQSIMEERLKLLNSDKDWTVMYHYFEYELNGKKYAIESYFEDKGIDNIHTSMAKTVGLPLGITVKNYLLGKIQLSGVQIPTTSEIYEPLLKELSEYGITFKEKKYNL